LKVGDGVRSSSGVIVDDFDAVGEFDAFDDLWQLVLSIKLAPRFLGRVAVVRGSAVLALTRPA